KFRAGETSMNRSDNPLRLDPAEAKLLGVCAGLARYLGVTPTVIGLMYCIACLAWPPLILADFILYWCLQHVGKRQWKMRFANSRTADHFRQLDYKRPIYRNPDDKKIAGVCSGFADYLDINPFIVRLLTFLSFFIFGPFTFWAYVV